MLPRVYIETTIPSYLTARPSRDLITAAHQQITRDWWERNQTNYECYISQFVLDECGSGNNEMARRRLELLKDVPVLEIGDSTVQLSKRLLEVGAVPMKAQLDSLHIAVATANGMDYLVTWNMKHIANAFMKRSIEQACRDAGFDPPVICTPEELLGDEDHVDG